MISCTDKFDRVVLYPDENSKDISYVLVEEIISHYADSIFENYKVEEKPLCV